MKKEILSVGAIVLLKDAKKRIMVVGYYPTAMKDGVEVTYDYCGCLFPEGIMDPKKALLFNHEDIDVIYFSGLRDSEQVDFLEKVKEAYAQLKNDQNVNSSDKKDIVENNNTNNNGNFTVISGN